MKKNSINETTYDYKFLKNKLKEIGDNGTEDDKIRLHRAISWLKCTEENENNPDIKFISLWIAFNASGAAGPSLAVAVPVVVSVDGSFSAA